MSDKRFLDINAKMVIVGKVPHLRWAINEDWFCYLCECKNHLMLWAARPRHKAHLLLNLQKQRLPDLRQ